jgi:hypothetical protein
MSTTMKFQFQSTIAPTGSIAVTDGIDGKLLGEAREFVELAPGVYEATIVFDPGVIPPPTPSGTVLIDPVAQPGPLYDQESGDLPLPQFCQQTRRSSSHGLMQCQRVTGHKEDHHYAPLSYLRDNPVPIPPPS